MMKKNISMAVCILLFVFLIACGKQNDKETVKMANTNKTVNTEMADDNAINSVEDIAENIDDIKKQEINLNLTEYQYSFEDQNVSLSGEPILNEGNFVELYETVTLTDSVDLYIDADICIGHTKPNVTVSLMSKYGNWYMVSVGDKVRYAKVNEVDAVILKETEVIEKVTIPEEETTASTTTSSEASPVVEVPMETPVEDPPVVTESNKYTPDEAIAVYRSLMEAGGMTWDPSLKNGGSWGSGWIYLDKGQPEWCASTNLESAAMGDSVGNPWTHFYLEVTGSDENAVYITEWAD